MTKATMTKPTITRETAEEAVRYEPVDRRSALSVREFKGEYFNRKPVVVTDGIKGWTAQSSWTFEKFKSRFGKSIVSVYPYENGTYRADHAQKISLAEYIDNILTYDFESYPYYLIYNFSLLQEHKELWGEFSEPKYCFDWFKFIPSFMRFPSPRIYLGPKGAVSTLHQDRWGSHFWMAQLEGRKRWILFPPEDAEFLYWTRGTGVNRGLCTLPSATGKSGSGAFSIVQESQGSRVHHWAG